MLIEQLTYAGICHIGERCGLRLRGLALDDEGVLPDALDAACRSEPARAPGAQPDDPQPDDRDHVGRALPGDRGAARARTT